MAQEEVVIGVKIEAAESAKTIAEMRKALKDLINQQQNVAAGSADWKKLAKAINDTEGRIGDLTDSFKTLKGSGVERTTASIGLLTEGFNSFDTGKIKLGLQGIGAAFKAIPIFLIIEGIRWLIDNFNDLKESGGLVGKVFTAIGDAIDWVSGKIEEFNDWISNVDTASKKLAEAQIEAAKKAKDAVGERYDFEIAKASAAGKETIGLEQEKWAATIKRIDDEIEAINKLGDISHGLSTKQKKDIEELVKAKEKALQAEELANIKFIKAIDDAIAKQEEKEKEKEKKKKEDAKKAQEKAEAESKTKKAKLEADWNDALAQQEKEEAERTRRLEIDKKNAKAEADAKKAQLSANEEFLKGYYERENKRLDESIAKEKAAHEKKVALAWETANLTIQAAKSVSDFLFMDDEDRLKSDKKSTNASIRNLEESTRNKLENENLTAEQRKAIEKAASDQKYALQIALYNKEITLKKKQFETDKKFNIARATADGISATQKAFAQGGGWPAGLALAIPTGVMALANVLKIKATKFDGGDAPMMDMSSGGGGGSSTAPQINTQAPIINPNTTFDSNGRNTNFVVTAKVYEGEMSKAQERTAKLEAQRTI